MTTILQVWAVTLALSLACWGIGSFFVRSTKPLVAMLCGWCAFLLLCAIPWLAGWPAHAMRPFFWAFALAGLVGALRSRRWPDLIAASLCTAVITAMVCAPFHLYPGLLAYGAHGTDMWGYVTTSDWLVTHSIRDLPEVGDAPMRFNWTWHVLGTGERPLVFESLACLASASGLSLVQAYFAYPVAVLASLAMAVSRGPRVFGLKHWGLALPPAIVLVFHPLIILPWIAGFYGGMMVALFAALAFAAMACAEEGAACAEALALGWLMLIFCAGLYTAKFLLVGYAAVLAPALFAGGRTVWYHGWRRLLAVRPGRLVATVVPLAVLLGLATAKLSGDPEFGPSIPQPPMRALGHFLGVFGGSSPYTWLGFKQFEPLDYDPARNPAGSAALMGLAILLGMVSWQRWQASRDIRVPVVVGICLGCLWMVRIDERMMAKAMPAFGFSLLVVLAAVSGELRRWQLGLAAAIVCCLPGLRSAPEMQEMIHRPYIACTTENIASLDDGEVWRTLAYLHFREDIAGFDWPKYPRMYRTVTHFLPVDAQHRLERKYHVAPP